MKKLPPETLNARINRLVPHFEIHKPKANGVFPTIIMLHGCGRADGPQPLYVKYALENGYACIVIDSFAPRHISILESTTTVCTGLQLWGRDRAGDLVCALKWAQDQEWVDNNNIFAIGWSHGGWTIMDGLALENSLGRHANITDLMPNCLEGLKSVFLVYPWCGGGSHSFFRGWQRNIPAHMIVCGQDYVVGTFLPKRTAEKLKETGVNIETSYYPTATHSFDDKMAVHPAVKYELNLAHDGAREMIGFFKKHLA